MVFEKKQKIMFDKEANLRLSKVCSDVEYKKILKPMGRRKKKIVFEANFLDSKDTQKAEEMDKMIAEQLGAFGLFN